MQTNTISVKLWQDMLAGGYRNLKQNMSVIDDLNVFPVPDGDTGKNMTMTIEGGVSATQGEFDDIASLMTKFSRSSLLTARGNSGVILSQFIRGLAIGSELVNEFTPETFTKAYECGV
ncbi:MAG: DAK2 domain-containing protein, partial [Clostridia bacterium]|nr:DAK2 domain-containing protein [Clostridia bacterium]